MAPSIQRRAVLKGVGVGLTLPLLEATAANRPAANGDDAPPKRLAIISTPFGMAPENFHPAETGRAYAMPETLKALEPHRDRFTTFSNLDHGMKGGHSATHTFLTGVKHTQRASHRDGNISVDQRAAELLGGQTRFSSLTFWNSKASPASWTRTGVAIPAIPKPSDAFRLMFVDATQTDREVTRAMLAGRGSILDTVRHSAKTYQRKLGRADNDKLDEYFTSIREVERKLGVSQDWLDQPKPRIDDPAMKGVAAGARDETIRPDLYELWLDLMRLALHTDSTRFVTTSLYAHGVWGFEGITDDYHRLTHHGQRPEVLAQLAITEKFQMSQLARFITRLEETKQFDGSSLLDSTTVLFGSGMGSGSRHSSNNLPLIMAGGGWKHAGHLDMQNKQPLCNLYLSMLQHLGAEVDYFNTSTGTLTGLG